MNKSTINLSIILLILILLIITNIDFKKDQTEIVLTFLGSLVSAVIGGFVAFYAAKIQVEGHQKIDIKKETRAYKNLIIVIINELEDFNVQLGTIIKSDSDFEINIAKLKKQGFFKEFIPVESLEDFRKKFVYVIEDKENLTLFLSVYNRMYLLRSDLGNPDIQKIRRLHKDINHLILLFKKISKKNISV